MYLTIVDPWADLGNIAIDKGAKRIGQDDGKGWGTVFTRYYSPESFAERVWAKIPDSMVPKIVYCGNLPENSAVIRVRRSMRRSRFTARSG